MSGKGTTKPGLLLWPVLALGWVARKFRTPGRVRLARLLARYAPRQSLVFRDQWGYRRIANLSDELEAQSFLGAYSLGEDVAALLSPGDWVVDAGASIGSLTAQFCHLMGPAGLVWAVEPVPENVSRLTELKRLNALQSLQVFAGALGAETGQMTLRLPARGGSAFASFTKSWDMAETIEVQTWSLDDLVYDQLSGRRIALLKIDVEGYEPKVLAGAVRTLREMQPWIMCEFNDILLRDAGSSAAALLQIFARMGYLPVRNPADLEGRVTDVLLRPANAGQ